MRGTVVGQAPPRLAFLSPPSTLPVPSAHGGQGARLCGGALVRPAAGIGHPLPLGLGPQAPAPRQARRANHRLRRCVSVSVFVSVRACVRVRACVCLCACVLPFGKDWCFNPWPFSPALLCAALKKGGAADTFIHNREEDQRFRSLIARKQASQAVHSAAQSPLVAAIFGEFEAVTAAKVEATLAEVCVAEFFLASGGHHPRTRVRYAALTLPLLPFRSPRTSQSPACCKSALMLS